MERYESIHCCSKKLIISLKSREKAILQEIKICLFCLISNKNLNEKKFLN